jgi:hypothetical protein
VLARTKEADASGRRRFAQRLHALDIATGTEKPDSPAEIAAAVKGTGAGSSNGSVAFVRTEAPDLSSRQTARVMRSSG